MTTSVEVSNYRKIVEVGDAGTLLGYVGQCFGIGWHAFQANGTQIVQPGVLSFGFLAAKKAVSAAAGPHRRNNQGCVRDCLDSYGARDKRPSDSDEGCCAHRTDLAK